LYVIGLTSYKLFCSKIWRCNINSMCWTWLYCGGNN